MQEDEVGQPVGHEVDQLLMVLRQLLRRSRRRPPAHAESTTAPPDPPVLQKKGAPVLHQHVGHVMLADDAQQKRPHHSWYHLRPRFAHIPQKCIDLGHDGLAEHEPTPSTWLAVAPITVTAHVVAVLLRRTSFVCEVSTAPAGQPVPQCALCQRRKTVSMRELKPPEEPSPHPLPTILPIHLNDKGDIIVRVLSPRPLFGLRCTAGQNFSQHWVGPQCMLMLVGQHAGRRDCRCRNLRRASNWAFDGLGQSGQPVAEALSNAGRVADRRSRKEGRGSAIWGQEFTPQAVQSTLLFLTHSHLAIHNLTREHQRSTPRNEAPTHISTQIKRSLRAKTPSRRRATGS
eukprot:jgi/Mesvir1/15804/Mv26147-RA.1